MKIWVVTEYVLTEDHPAFGEEQNIGYYSSKQKAIKAIYSYLLNDFELKDVINHVKIEEEDDEVYITTECGEDYGMYDCRYEIISTTLNRKLGE
jgi:hypothetical protein